MDTTVIKRPRTVTVAVVILALLLIASLIEDIVNPQPNEYASALARAFPFAQYIQLAGHVLGTLVVAFFIYCIFKGKNWARIVYLIFLILGVLASIPVYLGALHVQGDARIVGAIRLVAMFVAIVLLFTAPGKFWFSHKPT